MTATPSDASKYRAGEACPECPATADEIESNNARRRSDVSFCCTRCRHQWDADQYAGGGR